MRVEEARALIDRYAQLGILTRRQEQIVELLADGKTIGEIAAALGVTPGTVHAHIGQVKLRIRIAELRQEQKR